MVDRERANRIATGESFVTTLSHGLSWVDLEFQNRRQVIATLLSRCGVPDSGVGLTQFFADGDGFTPRTSEVSLVDRPPMKSLRPGL